MIHVLGVLFTLWVVVGVAITIACILLNDEYAVVKGVTWPMLFWRLSQRCHALEKPESFSKMWDEVLDGSDHPAREHRHRTR